MPHPLRPTPPLLVPIPAPQDAGSASSDPDSVNHHFIKAALPHLVPLLLEQLTKQEEGQETDDGVWNVSMVGGRRRGWRR